MVTDFSKQTELIEVHDFNTPINIIGCGALGSWLVFFLLKMGFKDITVYDFDDVEEHNLPNQMFAESHIGKPKVESMENLYFALFSESEKRIKFINEKVTPDIAKTLSGVVFSAVDSMRGRSMLYKNSLKMGKADLFLEGRIGLFGAYCYTVEKFNLKAYEEYEKTLYDDEEAEVSACGVSQTALPAAVNCASIMIMQMLRWHRKEKSVDKIEYQIPEMIAFTDSWKNETSS